jgi:hypothetical protein
MKKHAVPLSCLLSALGLLGCGSGGGSDAGGEVGEIETAIHTAMLGDGPSRCTVSTQSFLEQTTHEAGAAALRACEEAAQDSSLRASSESVSDVKVKGESATAAIAIHGSPLNGQVVGVSLAKDDEGWKLDELTGFVRLDRSTLAKVTTRGT